MACERGTRAIHSCADVKSQLCCTQGWRYRVPGSWTIPRCLPLPESLFGRPTKFLIQPCRSMAGQPNIITAHAKHSPHSLTDYALALPDVPSPLILKRVPQMGGGYGPVGVFLYSVLFFFFFFFKISEEIYALPFGLTSMVWLPPPMWVYAFRMRGQGTSGRASAHRRMGGHTSGASGASATGIVVPAHKR